MNRYDSYESDSTNQVLSFVCGAIVGAAAALLFAPMRGQEMRASIGDAARQGKDRLREYGEAGREWAQDRMGQDERSVKSSLDDARSSIDEGLDRTGSALSSATSHVEDALDRAGSTRDRNLAEPRSTAREDGRAGDPLGNDRSRESW